jgi:hypothetical protein
VGAVAEAGKSCFAYHQLVLFKSYAEAAGAEAARLQNLALYISSNAEVVGAGAGAGKSN